MIGVAVLDEAHRCKGAAVEVAANRGPVLVNRAATLPQVNAAPICAPLQDQFAITVPLCEQVGQAFPIALTVHRDARVVAAGGTAGAQGTGPAALCHQASRKSFWVQPTERFATVILLPNDTAEDASRRLTRLTNRAASIGGTAISEDLSPHS
jgi:hypothetical protein